MSFLGNTCAIYGLAWSPDSTRIATSGDDATVLVWDASTGRILFSYRGHTGRVAGVAWSPDSRHIVSAGINDGTARVWDASSGSTLHVSSVNPPGASERVRGVAWSPDGRRVAACNDAGVVTIWDAASDALVVTYRALAHSVQTVRFFA